ncbi:MAG: LolA family protein [Bacillota bacterium]|jgi:outer membrane lipoprotein-sorting protein
MPTKRAIWCLLSLCLLFLPTGCQSELTPEQVSQSLLSRLEQVESYQIQFLLQSSGQSLQVVQWYRAPDCVRTELYEQDEPTYRFIGDGKRLLVWHLPSGYRQQVELGPDSQLFCSPLLLDCCRLASTADWELEADSGLYASSFIWLATDGAERTGRLWVEPASWLPTRFELVFRQREPLTIQVQSLTINQSLSDNLFSLDI